MKTKQNAMKSLALYDTRDFVERVIRPLEGTPAPRAIELLESDAETRQELRRAVSIHCILEFFEPVHGSVVTKSGAYEDCKAYFEGHYAGHSFVGYPEFGKLMKLMFNCTTRRMGSRTNAKYCYCHVRYKQEKARWVNAKHPKNNVTRLGFLDDTIRFHVILRPLYTKVDDVFLQFLYNDRMDFTKVNLADSGVNYMLQLLAKSDMLFKNFMESSMQEGVFDQVIQDWYAGDLMSVFSDTMTLPRSALSFISAFPMVIDPASSAEMFFDGFKPPLQKYFKVDFQYKRANKQKLKVINFFIELLLKFPKVSLPRFILNFKFVTTSVLRHLTIKKMTSFPTYWVLGCFMDEFLQFFLEYYAFRSNQNRVLKPSVPVLNSTVSSPGSARDSEEPDMSRETTGTSFFVDIPPLSSAPFRSV